jgi:hypothetical protein
VLLLIALVIAVAAFVLWLELLIRAAAVYVAVLFLPLALASLVWPAVSHWCRRLVETLAALILSKFVIVATLSLAAGAVSSGTAGSGAHGSGFSSVLAGGALLVMATFVPFAILRMIPAVEAGAVGHLDGLRARGTSAVTRPARSAANQALHGKLEALGAAKTMAQTAEAVAERAAAGGGERTSGGEPASQAAYDSAVEREVQPRPKGEKPVRAAPTSEPDPGSTGEGADQGAESRATGFEPDPAQRVGARRSYGLQARIGPETPDDAWMWEGVPPGQGLIRRYEPGERRYYMGDDGGPSLKELPPAWPPGEGPDS